MGVRSIPSVHSKLNQEVGCHLDLGRKALDPAGSPKYLGNLRLRGTGERRPHRCSVITPVSPFSALPLNLSPHTCLSYALDSSPTCPYRSPCPLALRAPAGTDPAGLQGGPWVPAWLYALWLILTYLSFVGWVPSCSHKQCCPHTGRQPGAPLLMLNSLQGPLVSDPLRRFVRSQFVPGLSTSSPVFQLCR